MFLKKLFQVVVISGAFYVPVSSADVGAGIGLSYTFGQGFGFNGTVFSDDKRNSAVFAVGVDYTFGKGAWRPHVGGAYLGHDTYIGLNVGYDVLSQGANLGVSVGAVDTEERNRSGPGASSEPELPEFIGPPVPE